MSEVIKDSDYTCILCFIFVLEVLGLVDEDDDITGNLANRAMWEDSI